MASHARERPWATAQFPVKQPRWRPHLGVLQHLALLIGGEVLLVPLQCLSGRDRAHLIPSCLMLALLLLSLLLQLLQCCMRSVMGVWLRWPHLGHVWRGRQQCAQ